MAVVRSRGLLLVLLGLLTAPLSAAQPQLPSAVVPPAMPAPSSLVPEHEVTQLLRSVQDQIELDSRLGGALLIQAVCVPPGDPAHCNLSIRGKVAAPEQLPLIHDAIQAMTATDPFWTAASPNVTVDLSLLTVVPPNAARALRYYEIALDEYFHGNYPTADFAFARALSEEPTSVVFRYWRVLTAIALGEFERAERKLEPLLAIEPLGSKQTIVAGVFERVQGPLRWKLAELEEYVLLYRLP